MVRAGDVGGGSGGARRFRQGRGTVRAGPVQRPAIWSTARFVFENPRKDKMNVFPAQRSGLPPELWIRVLGAHRRCFRGMGFRWCGRSQV